MHSSLNFKFMNITDSYTNNKVSDMNVSLEANDYGTFLVGISSIAYAVDGIVDYNHSDATDGFVSFFIKTPF